MAFAYTKDKWEKHRPRLLASTGFGKALKEFEEAKKTLSAKKTLEDVLAAMVKVEAALIEAEKVRKEVVVACKEKKYTETVTYLEKASFKDELNDCRAIGESVLDNYISRCKKVVAEELRGLETQLPAAQKSKLLAENTLKGPPENLKKVMTILAKAYKGKGYKTFLKSRLDSCDYDKLVLRKAQIKERFAPSVLQKIVDLEAEVKEAVKIETQYRMLTEEIRSLIPEEFGGDE